MAKFQVSVPISAQLYSSRAPETLDICHLSFESDEWIDGSLLARESYKEAARSCVGFCGQTWCSRLQLPAGKPTNGKGGGSFNYTTYTTVPDSSLSSPCTVICAEGLANTGQVFYVLLFSKELRQTRMRSVLTAGHVLKSTVTVLYKDMHTYFAMGLRGPRQFSRRTEHRGRSINLGFHQNSLSHRMFNRLMRHCR